MNQAANSFSCSCCGKAVAKPRFIGGKAFGPSCYKKRMGVGAKASKAAYIVAERVTVDLSGYTPKVTYKVEGIETTFTICASMPVHAYDARGESWEDELPEGALPVLNAQGKPLFKSLRISFADGVLIHSDAYGKETTLPLKSK